MFHNGRHAIAARIAMAAMTLAIGCLPALRTTAAQNVADDQSRAANKYGDSVYERVIISAMPKHKSRVYRLLAKLLGKAKGKALAVTQSEVWTVPALRAKALAQQLQQIGTKVALLSEDWNYVLKRISTPLVMSPTQEEMLKRTRAAREFVGYGIMKAPDAATAEYALTADGTGTARLHVGKGPPKNTVSRIVLPINETQQITIQREKIVTTIRGTSWQGTIEGTGEGALLMWWKDGHLTGIFPYKGHIYTIVNMGGEVHAVVETDPALLPPDHAPTTSDSAHPRGEPISTQFTVGGATPEGLKPFADGNRRKLEAKEITIDVMMLYTKKVASRYILSPADQTELAVEQANETFRNSGLGNVSLRLVHTELVDYDETGSQEFDHLYRMVDGVDAFKDVHRLRNEQRADIVGLMVEDPSGCGLSTRVGADAEEAYFVVHHSCATLTNSVAHEIGHILGARHDRVTDAHNSPFPYGHGYINGSKWRDIMSYAQGCDGCPRIPFWSNPRITYHGEPTGTLAEDNARVILEQAERVSTFR